MTAALVLLAASAMAGVGLDARLAAGLPVSIQRVDEPVAVDGTVITLQQATGQGAPELARRLEAQWRRQGSRIEQQRLDGWQVRSRILHGRSEVLQWREPPHAPLLLWSSLELRASIAVPRPDLILPAGCVWGRSIFGKSDISPYLQRSARCPHSIPRLVSILRKTLPSQGWLLTHAAEASLAVERQRAVGLVSLTTQDGDEATWLTWLRMGDSP